MKHYNQLKETLLPLLNTNKRYGFFTSGGFDSTLLLYCSLKLKHEHNLPSTIICYTVPRTDDSIIHSQRIIGWLNSIFNISLSNIIVGNPKLHHSQQVSSGLLQAKKSSDMIVLGDTTNPPHLIDGPVRIQSTDPNIIQPFINWTKKDTVALSNDLIIPEIMTITHTCTESKLLRCNNCWQCKERAWGFAQNDIVDIGTM